MIRTPEQIAIDEWSRDPAVLQVLCDIERVLPSTDVLARLTRDPHAILVAKAFAVWAARVVY
jgi:hypothetical protein